MSFGGNQFNPLAQEILLETELIELHLHNTELWVPADIRTAVSPVTGALANTYGNWVQAIAATTDPWIDFHKALLCNPLINPLPADGIYEVDIGIGAAPDEVAISHIRFNVDATGGNMPRAAITYICPRIAQGTRVAVRAKCSTALAQTLNMQFGYHAYMV